MKILITGSNGLVGSSLTRILTTSNPSFNILPTTRKDANLFSFEETKNLILSKNPLETELRKVRLKNLR